MATTAEQIQEIYIGLLGRAADKSGLDYWSRQIYLGQLSIEQLRANIVNEQPEYQNGLGSMSRLDVIIELYQRLFERDPDTEGLVYWSSGGGSSVNVDQLVLALSDGASAVDRRTISHKTEAAIYYTNTIPVYDETTAKEAVDSVNDDYATVTASKTTVDSYLNTLGESFDLSTSADNLTGTAANDTFNAAGGANAVTNSSDIIDGGAGIDTLKIDSTGNANTVTGSFTSVENLTFIGSGQVNNDQTIDISSFDRTFTLDETTDILINISNVEAQKLVLAKVADTTALHASFATTQKTAELEFSAIQGSASFELTGSTLETANITIDETVSGGTATVADTGTSLKTANITATGASTVAINAAQLQTITVSGTGHVTLSASVGPSLAINAGASTGGVTLTSALANNALFTGSSAGDTVTFGATTQPNRMGGGDDTAIIDSIAALGSGGEVDSGSGTDTLQMTGSTAATLSSSSAFSSGIAGFEKLVLTDTTNQTIDMTNLDGLADITVSGNGNTLTLNNLAANSTVTMTDTSTQTALSVLNAASNGSDQVTIKLSSAATLAAGTVTANNIETISIDSDDTDTTAHTNTLTLSADAITTLNISGNAQLNLTLSGATTLSTVNASSNTAGITLDISHTNSVQLTGSSGADTITLSSLDQ